MVVLAAVVNRAHETRKALDDYLAYQIATRVGQLFDSRRGA